MKPKSPLTLSLVASLLAAQSLVGAETPKKAAKKSAEKPVAAEPKEAEKAPAAPADAGPEITDPVAVVEGVNVTKAELDQALTEIMAQRGGSPADIPAAQRAGAYRMVLDNVIIDKLVTSRSAGLKITDEEVEATFKRVTASASSPEEIQAQIQKAGTTMAKVKENIRSQLRQQHWIDDQIKGKDVVTEPEAEEFYKGNPEQFKSPERVRASHILLSVKADAKPEEVTAKQKAAEAIAARAKKGEDFAKLAKELSEDPSAKQNSGDLDFFAKEQMVPEFSAAAFAMKKGEISEPVRSQFGYHVIKVTDRKDAEVVPFEKTKPQLLAFLQQQKKQKEIEKLVEGLRAAADVKINLPEPAPLAPAAAAAPEAEKPAAESEAAKPEALVEKPADEKK